jgi:DNA-binding NarL/FixJ family response regulator
MSGKRPAVRILIVDSQTMFREGLKALFASEPDFKVIADTDSIEDASNLIRSLNPDILLIDLPRLRLNSGNSDLQVLRQLTAISKTVKPILMTAGIKNGQVLEALKAGVRGILMKESGIALFLKCIRTVMADGHWVSRDAVSELITNFRDQCTQPLNKTKSMECDFSRREKQVLRAIAYGYSNNDIAKELAVSEQAVKYHLTKLFRKVGVANRMELARFTIDNMLELTS